MDAICKHICYTPLSGPFKYYGARLVCFSSSVDNHSRSTAGMLPVEQIEGEL